MKLNSISNRIEYIDSAKGIAILLVVFAHMIIWGYQIPYGKGICNFIYSFHMPAFFAISGCLFYLKSPKEEISFSKNLKKLVSRRLPLYFLWSIIYFLFNNNWSENITWHEEIAAIITLRGRAPLWFLSALFLSEVSFIFLFTILPRKKKNIYLLIFFIFLGLLSILSWRLYRHFNLNTISNIYLNYLLVTFFRNIPCLFFMISGYFFGLINEHIKILSRKIICLIIFAILSVSFSLLFINFKNNLSLHVYDLGKHPEMAILYGLMGSYCILFLCKALEGIIISKFLRFIGSYSLGIMIIHNNPPMPTLWISDTICRIFRMNFNTITCFITVYVILLSVSILITYIITEKRLFFK